MKIVCLLAILIMLLIPTVCSGVCSNGECVVPLTFTWTYPELKDGDTWLAGWGLYFRTESSGYTIYTGIDFIVWDGVVKPSYTITVNMLMPQDKPDRYLFIVHAKMKETPENFKIWPDGPWSLRSREAPVRWDGRDAIAEWESPDILKVNIKK